MTEILDARCNDDDVTLEEGLLSDLADDVQINEQALARKEPLIAWAVALLVFAIVIQFAGVQ